MSKQITQKRWKIEKKGLFNNRRIDHERWMRNHVAVIIAALAVLTALFADTLTSEKKREL